MITCTSCGCKGFLSEFTYLAQAGGVGPATLRRCPACGELIVIGELAEQDENIPSPKSWGLSGARGMRFSSTDREVEK